MKRMKFAHVEGYTDIAYSDNGECIITCGADGDYRIWKGYEDDDPECVRVGDEATALAFKNKRVYVGTDMHMLQIYSFPDNQPDGIVTRFTATVNHMSFNKDGSKIAAGSGDMTIKVKDLNINGGSSSKEVVYEGHDAPILSVSLDPKNEFLASSSCDGTVRLWSLSTGKQVQSWRWAPVSNDFCNSPTLCRVQFEPVNGRYLAVPAYTTYTIKLVDRTTWKEAFELVDDRLKEVSLCCWSPCGKYLATASKAGDMLVWDIQARKVVNAFQHEKKFQICSMAWNPVTRKEIAFCDSKGYLGLLENVTTPAQQQPEPQLDENKIVSVDDAAELFGDDDDAAEFSISQIKKATGFTMNEEDGKDVFTGVRAGSTMDNYMLDDAASKISSRPTSPLTTTSKRLNFPSCKKQEPFQPGSSPVHLQNRYMMWNNVGIVRCFSEETNVLGSIEVEFHDTSIHHGLHIPNTLGHTMAALSTQALVLACPSQDDGPSKIVCVNFSSWDGNKEWSTSLPTDEEALALAAGDSWVAVATSRRLLRFFSNAGLQRGMLSLPGPIVCMTGYSSKLFIAYHMAMGTPGEQAIGYALVSIDKRSPVGYKWLAQPQSLPLGPECDLSWAGFSDEGTLATMDSSGLLQIQPRVGLWMPLLDTRQNIKGKSDHYFLIGLSEIEKCVRCILCKGARYPLTLPRPNLALLDIKLPLCDAANEKSQLEEALIQSTMHSQLATSLDQAGFDMEEAREKAERASRESLMKMFALASQAEREVRALEVADWMNSEQLLQLAIKYATRARKRQLANRLTELAEQFVRERDAADVTLMSETSQSYSSYSISQTSQVADEDRDMFTSTPPVIDVEANPILQVKQRKSSITGAAPVIEPSKTIRPLSQVRKNPFAKKSSTDDPSQPATPSPRGLAVFDQPKASAKPATGPAKENIKTKTTKQATLFGLKKTPAPAGVDDSAMDTQESTPALTPTSTPKSGFMLWLEQNKAELRENHPEATEAELVRLAAQKFKTLPEEERQNYTRKRKSSGSAEQSEDAPKKTRPTLAEKLASFEA